MGRYERRVKEVANGDSLGHEVPPLDSGGPLLIDRSMREPKRNKVGPECCSGQLGAWSDGCGPIATRSAA